MAWCFVLSTFLLLVSFCSSQTITTKCKKNSLYVCYTPGLKVCGSNGHTYGSICLLKAAQCNDTSIKLSYYGECVKCGQRCGHEYDPVCGNNGITYGNICRLRKARCLDRRISFYSRGHCRIGAYKPRKEPIACPTSYIPVCGNNGITYTNLCFLKKAQRDDKSIKMHTMGRCMRRDYACLQKYARCSSTDYKPVCGNNGVTYNNLCMLRRAQCEVKSITSYSYGRCVKKDDGCGGKHERCSATYNPVCGNNGKTYRNLCYWKKAQCKDEALIYARRGRCSNRLRITLKAIRS